MNILCIEGSGNVASVAVMTEEKLLAEYSTDHKKTHSQTLLPMADEVLRMTELDIADMDYIAVSKGPGSFTGVRIVASTAKGLAYALNKPIAAVGSLDAMSYNYYGCEDVICPMMDARRAQVYAGLYTFENDENGAACHKVLKEADALGAAELLDEAIEVLKKTGKDRIIFLGDGVPVNKELIETKMKEAGVKYSFAPLGLSRQKASSLGLAAFDEVKAGRLVSAEEFAPEYLRLSQAERIRLENGKSIDPV